MEEDPGSPEIVQELLDVIIIICILNLYANIHPNT